MSRRDYYDILGLRKGASLDDIKRRFRKLAFRYHPDRNAGDAIAEEMFKLVAEAYHVLSDNKRRHLYDHKGSDGLKKQGYQGFERTEDVLRTFASELFGFLGVSPPGRQPHPSRGADLCYQLELSSDEAARGGKKYIQVSSMETCPECRGNGVKQTVPLQNCPWCHGSGRYSETSGIFAAVGTCPKCNGKGRLRLLSCTSCEGMGRRQIRKELLVHIPAGVENNARLKLSHEGDGGEVNAEDGDLYVDIQIKSNTP
jgi:molecular chaperone DnaJ